MALERTLKELRDWTAREIRKLKGEVLRPLGEVQAVSKSEVAAKWGQIIRVDTSDGGVTVRLPRITSEVINKTIAIKKTTTDSNAVTILPHSGDNVDGSTSYSFTTSQGSVIFVAANGNWGAI